MSQKFRGPWRPSCFSDRPEKHKLGRRRWDLASSKPKFRWIPFRGEVEMSRPIRGQGGNLVFPIGPKSTNLVEDVEILLPVKFVALVSEEKSKMSRPNRGQGGHLVYPIGPEKHTIGKGRWDFASSLPKFRWIPFRGEVEMSRPIRGQGGHLVFPIGPKSTNLVEDVEILLPVKFVELVSEEKSKMSRPNRGQGDHLVYAIRPKNKNLVEDVEILFPIKCHWIPFSGFREEVENISANQRPGRPSCFSDRPEKHNFGWGRWHLARY